MSTERTLGGLGERQIVDTVLRSRYPWIGDDCAVLSDHGEAGDLVATTDSCPTPLVALLGDEDPYHAGWLLATINLSDLAAAGARPLGLLTSYTLPASTTVAHFERLLSGVDDCCAEHGVHVVGGDIRDGELTLLSATALGRCVPGHRLRRDGASEGDRLLLVGHPGFLWAWALLVTGGEPVVIDDGLRAELRQRSRRPAAQVTAGRILAAEGLASACLDVSDGLYSAVRALCRANKLGAEVRTDVSLEAAPAEVCRAGGVAPFALAQTWGDWNLLVAVPARLVEVATEKLRAAGSHVVEVGTLTAPRHGVTLDGLPWHGVDQERFSAGSWHGGDLREWLRRVLDVSRDSPDSREFVARGGGLNP